MIDTIREDVKFVHKYIHNVNKFKNKSILITGATGFFGKWILEIFYYMNTELNYNINITILTRSFSKFILKYPKFKYYNLDYIEGDVRTFELSKNTHYDFLIHAANDNLEEVNPKEMYNLVTEGSNNIIYLSKLFNIGRVLFISSASVYGKKNYDIDKISEDTICNPTTAYGKGKKYAEDKFLDSNIDVVISRCFSFVGPYIELDIHYAIGNFIRNVINNEDIIIKGDGRAYRSYMYMADLVYWLLSILINANTKTIYNVGSDIEISIYDLAKLVSNSINDYTGNIKILTKPDYTIPPERYIPDNTKIKKELNVKENYNLDYSIRRTIEWNIMNGEKYE
ncbi:NAD(P)-dependent oxidoreductase [Brachyspira intermedia]|uniref:NAD-dependent epimerase/dehydratase family protein n=1 Tax=Brachyspira intermedia TaxID=84377 RepID=UPI003007437E